MIPLSPDELQRWRAEIELGVKFRDKEFGTYHQEQPGTPPSTTLAGHNLDEYESGARSDESTTIFNLIFPIVKNVVPTLFYQNPRVTALPDSRSEESGEDAFYASELLNRDLRDPDFRIKDTSQQVTFDDYVLGFGVVKIGYATEFGADILPTKAETRKSFRERITDKVKAAMTSMGIIAPTPVAPEPEPVQADQTIRAEHPYLQWVSPFDFVVDPRARTLTDARWVAQRIRRTLGEIKRDRRFRHVKFDLEPDAVDDSRIPQSYVEEFQTADEWEIHYKTGDSPTGIRILTIAVMQEQQAALMHEDSVYDLGGWQYEWQCLNKHGHRLYPISTLSIARPMIRRLNESLEAILEQVSKFQAKIAYNERLTTEGQTALKSAILGAHVKVSGMESVEGAIAVISMQQVAADMVAFVKNMMDFVLLIVGLTQAQLTGLSTAQTATEAQIGQGGQNLRRTDEANIVGDWFNRVLTKLWRVKAQFQDLEAIDLPQDGSTLDTTTQTASTQWYPPIDAQRAARLKATRFRFHLEVGSMQKPNLDVIRAQFQQWVQTLMDPIVTQGLALEGKRLSASELIRQSAKFYAEYGLDNLMNQIVVPITDPAMQQALQNYGMPQQGTSAPPMPTNGQRAHGPPMAAAAPNRANLISSTAGEKGQGASPRA